MTLVMHILLFYKTNMDILLNQCKMNKGFENLYAK
jgi:hypothetical protein